MLSVQSVVAKLRSSIGVNLAAHGEDAFAIDHRLTRTHELYQTQFGQFLLTPKTHETLLRQKKRKHTTPSLMKLDIYFGFEFRYNRDIAGTHRDREVPGVPGRLNMSD